MTSLCSVMAHAFDLAGIVLSIAVLVRYGRDWLRGVL